ncbi:MAG: peptidyl-prolyl cis-trans isomerase [Burkholderiales bacterium]|jgi:peptidyl-prolyl cis-trans isomerase A (cyclophilin A)|nr:peptidyl-prolyl cis-trans isomerase [Microcystis sp. M015S1]MCA3148076.1 peptidyl-prolyl cis-trans isomerase [Burkholderiales bacterium]MCA3155538.1 peptidyl-prolyl cis-trans isomerase [Burkholderiales bacterium]MCA3157771.1 peptidyl-prolyl cis-trans isomerase [Burkholderiales bacterium]MCA3159579.1 peptidyl-prolyl cis-trans isomerase [Burkholderiales bacterium]
MKIMLRLVTGLVLTILSLHVLAQSTQGPRVQLETSLGNIVLELNSGRAPQTVDNFLRYVREGHYNGTIFHRVINGFMIQGGGFDANMRQKPVREPIRLESQNGLRNLTGTVAMARTSDPHSATAQFFINVVDNSGLDFPNPDGHGYAVFGKVVDGMEVVNRIRSVTVGRQGFHQNVPREPIIIQKAVLLTP